MTNSLQGLTNFAKQRPYLVAGVALVFGFFVGWFLMGWGLWPIDFVDGSPAQLRADYQQDYVRLVAAEYALNPDLDRAAARIKELGDTAPAVMAATMAASQGEEALRIGQLQQVLEISGALNPAAAGGDGAAPSLWDQYRIPLLGCTFLILLIIAAVGAWYVWSTGMLTRGRTTTAGAGAVAATRVRPSAAATRASQPPKTDYSASGATTVMGATATPTGGPPVAQFMTTYVLGDEVLITQIV